MNHSHYYSRGAGVGKGKTDVTSRPCSAKLQLKRSLVFNIAEQINRISSLGADPTGFAIEKGTVGESFSSPSQIPCSFSW